MCERAGKTYNTEMGNTNGEGRNVKVCNAHQCGNCNVRTVKYSTGGNVIGVMGF
jgi:hypothetical protein